MKNDIENQNPIHKDSIKRITELKQNNEINDELLEKQIRDAVLAYSQLPFVNALLFGFTATSTSNPCKECQYQAIRDIIIVLISCSMLLSLTGLCISIMTIYHTYKLLAEADAQETQSYILETSTFRDIARNCTYGAFMVFIVSFAVCPIFSYSIGVAIFLAFIFVTGILLIVFLFRSLKSHYQNFKIKFKKQQAKLGSGEDLDAKFFSSRAEC